MKVKDLIKELEKFNPEANIIIDNISDQLASHFSWGALDGDTDSIEERKLKTDHITMQLYKQGESGFLKSEEVENE